MSITIAAKIVRGCLFSQLAEYYRECRKIKKFNEDTGKPYEKVEEEFGYRLKAIPSVKYRDRSELLDWLEYDEAGSKPQFDIGRCAAENTKGGYEVVVGMTLAEAERYTTEPVPLAGVENFQAAEVWLIAHGIRPEDIKDYLILYIS